MTADAIRNQLPDIGDYLAAQMVEISRDAAEERIDRALMSLHGAVSTLLRLKEANRREQSQANRHGP